MAKLHEEQTMKGLCVPCMKQGIKTKIETEVVIPSGRTVIVRTCGNHSTSRSVAFKDL